MAGIRSMLNRREGIILVGWSEPVECAYVRATVCQPAAAGQSPKGHHETARPSWLCPPRPARPVHAPEQLGETPVALGRRVQPIRADVLGGQGGVAPVRIDVDP